MIEYRVSYDVIAAIQTLICHIETPEVVYNGDLGKMAQEALQKIQEQAKEVDGMLCRAMLGPAIPVENIEKKSIFKLIKERGYGDPVAIITKINHHRGDMDKTSYTASIYSPGDDDTSHQKINKENLKDVCIEIMEHSPSE